VFCSEKRSRRALQLRRRSCSTILDGIESLRRWQFGENKQKFGVALQREGATRSDRLAAALRGR
jgi:hypothetical protein